MFEFNCLQKEYVCPRGALRAGQNVRFFCRAGDAARVRIVCAPEDGKEATYEMQKEPDGFSITLSFERIGLWFYRFEAILPDGSFRFIGRGDDGSAVVGDWLPRWQFTVYAADFTTPDKYAGGIMYQIFPDRFARVSDERPAAAVKGERTFHRDLRDLPCRYGEGGGTDFYGGSLEGVRRKLPYLRSLGVDILYFNPVFESAENHRYSTSDYLSLDPWLGSEAEFVAFCDEAHKMGFSVLLDGVFSHTGADSVYFNKYGHYGTGGAYRDPRSPYAAWYDFEEYPDGYACWWGFPNLPNVRETDPSYLSFITGKDGVLEHWQRRGADGWRLDVADELPDRFLEALRDRVKTQDPDALIIGEVWENAVRKVSYGARRRFLLGHQCDSVMNYPWRTAIIDLLKDGDTALFAARVREICDDYPAPVLNVLMNLLSSHDRERILTALGAPRVPDAAQPGYRLPRAEYLQARELAMKAAMLQFTLPGIPCIYYGDEIGMQGFKDPWNRAFFAEWEADETLLAFYRSLGALRQKYRTEFTQEIDIRETRGGRLVYTRGSICVCFNADPPGEVLLSSPDGTLMIAKLS